MNIACMLGRHEWNGCTCTICNAHRDSEHDFVNECGPCSICGTRDPRANHDWSKDCGKCARCGHAQYMSEMRHDTSKDCEICSRCGISLPHWSHNWSADCQQCARCKKTRSTPHDFSANCSRCARCSVKRPAAHIWEKDVCRSCGMTTAAAEKALIKELLGIHEKCAVYTSGVYKLLRWHSGEDVTRMAAAIYELAQVRGERSIERIKAYTIHFLPGGGRIGDPATAVELDEILVHVLGASPSSWIDQLLVELKRHAVEQGGFTELLTTARERGMCSNKECIGKNLTPGEVPLFPLDKVIRDWKLPDEMLRKLHDEA